MLVTDGERAQKFQVSADGPVSEDWSKTALGAGFVTCRQSKCKRLPRWFGNLSFRLSSGSTAQARHAQRLQ
jgi:hypothetical protein